jgi:hypothetical protein
VHDSDGIAKIIGNEADFYKCSGEVNIVDFAIV